MLALLFPGQGSQRPGMLSPWLDLPGAADDVDRWAQVAGLDIVRLGTTAPAEELRDTAVAQPLLTAAALLSARALLGGASPDVVCGHSVGELPALAVAGVVDDDTAVRLAAERGRSMARAASLAATGMTAVLGGDPAEVRNRAERVGLTVATVNVAGQLVVAGPVEGLAAFESSRPAGVRLRRLDVAGAFHTSAMLSAVGRLTAVLSGVVAADARCSVVANADGQTVTDGPELLRRLVRQVTSPVRFDLCLERLSGLGTSGVVEVAPGGTLAGLARRALPDVPVCALRGPEDVRSAQALVPLSAA